MLTCAWYCFYLLFLFFRPELHLYFKAKAQFLGKSSNWYLLFPQIWESQKKSDIHGYIVLYYANCLAMSNFWVELHDWFTEVHPRGSTKQFFRAWFHASCYFEVTVDINKKVKLDYAAYIWSKISFCTSNKLILASTENQWFSHVSKC